MAEYFFVSKVEHFSETDATQFFFSRFLVSDIWSILFEDCWKMYQNVAVNDQIFEYCSDFACD